MTLRGKVFISYRRDGGSEIARLIRDSLQQKGHEVFLDVEELRSGPFNTAIFSQIESSTDFIAILTPGSLDRCWQENDWMRLEIAHAIKLKKNIIPVMKPGFKWPAQSLPEDLKSLQTFNGVEWSHHYFDASIVKLTKLLIGHPKRTVPMPSAITLRVLLVIVAVYLLTVFLWQGEKTSDEDKITLKEQERIQDIKDIPPETEQIFKAYQKHRSDAFDVVKASDTILNQARESAKINNHISSEYEQAFLQEIGRLTNIWMQHAHIFKRNSLRSDIEAFCDAENIQQLTLSEARLMLRFLGLRFSRKSLTEISKSVAKLQLDLTGMNKIAFEKLYTPEHIKRYVSNGVIIKTPKPIVLTRNYVEIEKESAGISQQIINGHKKQSASGKNMTDRDADIVFLPGLDQHRLLRIELGQLLDGKDAVSMEDISRVSIALRHAGDVAAYIAYRFGDKNWLHVKIRCLELEEEYGKVIAADFPLIETNIGKKK